MFKRNIVPRFILSAFALTMLCMFSAVVNAQERPQGKSEAPLEGVDVRLTRYGGAQFASSGSMAAFRVKTDANGNFTFPVVPAGEYILTVNLPKDPDMKKGTVKWFDGERVSVTLNLAGGKKVEKGYDLEKNKFFSNPVVDRKIKRSTIDPVGEHFIVVSDGRTAATGTITIRI